jgi:diguanylate cyclase (GGDEF)-like protein/PAS domain S-box-containing protein
LWLGLGLILGLFAVADLVSLRAANRVDVALQTLVSGGDERRGAGYNMRSELAAMARAVQTYQNERDPRQRVRLNKAEKAFEQALTSYNGATSAERGRTLAQQLHKIYTGFKRQCHEVMRLKDARALALNALAAHQGTVDMLLGSTPVLVVPAHQFTTGQTKSQTRELESALRAAAVDLDQRMQTQGEAFELGMATNAQQIVTALSRYKKSAQTSSERIWAEKADKWYAELTGKVNAFLKADAVYEGSADQFTATARKLEDILTESIQPAARAELAGAVAQASGIAHQANVLITRGMLLALALGALAAMATVRAVRAPLARLVVSMRRLAEGDFSHRLDCTSRDELSQLVVAFNEMVEKLQVTTVSRGYLQSIVDSMGEVLIVVSRSGCVQTANPAAERLLGYAKGELSGQSLNVIVTAGSAAAEACAAKLPIRFTDELIHRQGFTIPVAIVAAPLPMQADAAGAVVCVAQDLRERLEAGQHQRQAAVVFENTTEGIILTDARGGILLVNPAFCKITGYETQEVQRLPILHLCANREGTTVTESVWKAVAQEGQWQGEIWMRGKDGALRPVWTNVSTVHDASGDIANFVAVFSDISAIKQAEERLNFLAHYDALTTLPNRLLLAERLRLAFDRAQRSGRSVGLLYLDLDDFKHVNDTLGHESGDFLLREMAHRLPRALRASDTVARLGGDEFIVVLDDLADVEHAAEVAEKLLKAVSAPFELSGLELRMNASIGISISPLHAATGEDLLKAADAAMYRAKRLGGGNYQFFTSDLTERALEQLTLKNALRHPNLCEQLITHYQPQVSIKTGHIVGVEALVRWQHPTRGLLSPGQFIPMAEEAGLIHVIGECVLKTACAQAKAWQDSGYPPLRIGVNVSAQELRTDAVVKRVESILRATGLHASLLELEVTESALQNQDGIVEILQAIKALGVGLALDDFGSGYSSLGSIRLLPLDRLKIDRSFVRDLQQQEGDRSLIRAIIAMGRTLKLETIAEGVETYSQFSFLRDEGCDEVQGFLLGKPMTAADLDRYFPDRIANDPGPALQLIHSTETELSRQSK